MGTECKSHLQIWLSLFSGCLNLETLQTIQHLHQLNPKNCLCQLNLHYTSKYLQTRHVKYPARYCQYLSTDVECLGIQEEEGSAFWVVRETSLPISSRDGAYKGFFLDTRCLNRTQPRGFRGPKHDLSEQVLRWKNRIPEATSLLYSLAWLGCHADNLKIVYMSQLWKLLSIQTSVKYWPQKQNQYLFGSPKTWKTFI